MCLKISLFKKKLITKKKKDVKFYSVAMWQRWGRGTLAWLGHIPISNELGRKTQVISSLTPSILMSPSIK
jgi:hypothetical protein